MHPRRLIKDISDYLIPLRLTSHELSPGSWMGIYTDEPVFDVRCLNRFSSLIDNV